MAVCKGKGKDEVAYWVVMVTDVVLGSDEDDM